MISPILLFLIVGGIQLAWTLHCAATVRWALETNARNLMMHPSESADTLKTAMLNSLAGKANADQLSAPIASAYFDWLAWLLLILLIGVGIAANLSVPMTDALRVAGFLLGLLGASATYFAIAQLHDAQVAAGAQKHSVFYKSSWGLWAAVIGYLAAAAGAALGPRPEAP